MQHNQPVELSAKAEIALGMIVLTVAMAAQITIVVYNVGYITHNSGAAMLVAYLSATVVILLMPLLRQYIEEHIGHKIGNIVLTGFVAWITIEENFHSTKGMHAPEAASSLLGAVVDQTYASKGATIALMLVAYVAMEFLVHMLHLGSHITLSGHKRLHHKHH